ncbi:MAG: preprotein translocase subunit SecY [Polyangiaceae bacterium]|nr:preprotein translocase subunit SecY [Polyangiaceae bacterium]
MAGVDFSNITRVPELRKRILFTLGMLAVYRVGVFITTPGVNRNILKASAAGSKGLMSVLNLFSGGALENASLFSLGIMPYVSASIIMQLLGMVYKPVEELRKEGEQGRRKIDQYTRYGTVLLALFQSWGVATTVLEPAQTEAGDAVAHPGIAFRLMTILTLTTGTAFLMWVGEQITERGIGNGISMLIFAGIVTDIPNSIANYFATNKGNIQPLTLAAVVGIVLATVAVIVFFERAQRRIPIQYSRRQVGRRVYGGSQTHLPLKVNTSGTIPPIFASSLLSFPATLASFGVWGMDQLSNLISGGSNWLFNTGYVLLIVFFCFFYTAVTFQPAEVADNLKKQQANIPGIRPGKQTADYIDRVLTRITFGGAMYVAAVCIVPTIVLQAFRVPFVLGGTSVMIVVGVALDTVSQVEAQLLTKNYDALGVTGTPKLRGRREATEAS